MQTEHLLLAIGSLILTVAAAMAAYYVYKLKEMQAQQKAAIEELKSEMQTQFDQRERSIRVLAQGLLDDELSLTEGAIRISALLTKLPAHQEHRENYRAFFVLAERMSHVPILEDWRSLSKKEQQRHTLEMLKAEADHQEFIIEASHRLLKDENLQRGAGSAQENHHNTPPPSNTTNGSSGVQHYTPH